MVQIVPDTYEDLTAESFEALLDAFERGETPKPGPQDGRYYSMPANGLTSLTEIDYAADDVPPGGAPTIPAARAPAPAKEASTQAASVKPTGLSEPRGGKPDDLKRISGVGPVNEERLNALGIFHFDQVAAWTAEEIAWVDEHLSFHGRIEREDWVGQAKKLAAGEGERS
jgi:NADH-quinone oxidoreductase subunit E